MKTQLLRLAVLPLVLGAAACDDETGPENERFLATLTGSAEVPAVNTPATGQAEFELQDDGSVTYSLSVQNIRQVVAAHIHGPAPAGVNAGILVSLFPTSTAQQTPTGAVNGQLAQGTFSQVERQGVSMDSLLTLMRTGNAYVNVHTNDGVAPTNTGPGDFPAGEIRGQLAPRR